MKLPALVFISAVLLAIVYPLANTYVLRERISEQGINAPSVREALERARPIDASGPLEERRFQVDYLGSLLIQHPLRVIHDPSMADEIIATGSKVALDHLNFNEGDSWTNMAMTRPLLNMGEVSVRLNLERHNLGLQNISSFNPTEEQSKSQYFFTAGTFRAERLSLDLDAPMSDTLHLNVERVDLSNRSGGPVLLAGRIKWLLLGVPTAGRIDLQLVQIETLNIGRLSSSIQATTFLTNASSIFYSPALEDSSTIPDDYHPDTLYCPVGSTIESIMYDPDRRAIPDSLLVVIRQ